jgi:hypothetical protein
MQTKIFCNRNMQRYLIFLYNTNLDTDLAIFRFYKQSNLSAHSTIKFKTLQNCWPYTLNLFWREKFSSKHFETKTKSRKRQKLVFLRLNCVLVPNFIHLWRRLRPKVRILKYIQCRREELASGGYLVKSTWKYQIFEFYLENFFRKIISFPNWQLLLQINFLWS